MSDQILSDLRWLNRSAHGQKPCPSVTFSRTFENYWPRSQASLRMNSQAEPRVPTTVDLQRRTPAMKKFAILLLLLASCGTTRITAIGGKIDLGSDIKPAEELTAGGIEVSSGPVGGGFGFELGASYGKDSGSEAGTGVTSEAFEEYAGARYEWRAGDWSPFISAGLSALKLRGHADGSPSAHDTDLGYYFAAGADYHFGSGWHFGGSLRKTIDHNLKFNGTEGDADAWQYLMRFGYAF
ncbi:MAG: hypothetical protein ACI8X5_001250 [Planctomycetota bacterium]|jgi:hypothetical protein